MPRAERTPIASAVNRAAAACNGTAASRSLSAAPERLFDNQIQRPRAAGRLRSAVPSAPVHNGVRPSRHATSQVSPTAPTSPVRLLTAESPPGERHPAEPVPHPRYRVCLGRSLPLSSPSYPAKPPCTPSHRPPVPHRRAAADTRPTANTSTVYRMGSARVPRGNPFRTDLVLNPPGGLRGVY